MTSQDIRPERKEEKISPAEKNALKTVKEVDTRCRSIFDDIEESLQFLRIIRDCERRFIDTRSLITIPKVSI
jgi:hypothetical protein